jgi:phage head maturation protease
MNTVKLDTQVTFLAAADGDAASAPKRFTIEAYTGSQIRQGWSREPVVIDLAGMTFKQKLPIVLGHDYNLGSILGQTDSVRVEAGKLIVEGEILADNDTARQVMALAERGYQWQASVGADVRRHQKIDAEGVTTVNGQNFVGPVRVVKASSLREVSFVTLGADAETSVAIAAEEAVEEVSMAADATQKLTDEAAAPVVAATAEVAVETKPETVEAQQDTTDVLLAKIDAFQKKVETMEKLIATRDERPAAPAVHVVANAAPSADVIEASFALQGGLANVEKHYDAKTLEAAHKVSRTASLGETLLAAAEANGYDGPRRINAGTLRPILQAAWATHSISNILSNTANKFLLAGFDSVESAWRSISAVRSVNDFKSVTSYRLNGGFTFEKVAPGGELKNAAASDESRTISADTYGIMTSVTRTDLINDDLSSLTALPQRIGRGGALKLNSVFWASFVDDSAFFTSGRGNLRAGAYALSLANLKAMATAFRKLNDPDGNPVAVTPRVLLVPPDLELTAAELMGSTLIQSGATGGQPDRNVLAGRYDVVSSVYLTNTTDYYLLASPSDLPVMEVAFLNGVQSPIVETAEADFNVLGIQMRGYFDFGVAKAEYLAGIKCDSSN